MRHLLRLLAAPALAAGATACAGLGGVRPYYGPVPGSVSLLVEAPPDAVTRRIATEVQTAGLRLLRFSPAEGYVETEWYNLDTQESGRSDHGSLDRMVKLRFFADPTAGRTRVLAECVTRLLYDPSLPERELERMVPEGHQGREILARVLARLREQGP